MKLRLSHATVLVFILSSQAGAQTGNHLSTSLTQRVVEIKGLSNKKEEVILDRLANLLVKRPDQTGYIVVYESCPGEAQIRFARMKQYLFRNGRIQGERVVFLVGGSSYQPYALVQTSKTGQTFTFAATHSRVGRKCCRVSTRAFL